MVWSPEFESFLRENFLRSKESIFEKRTHLWAGQITPKLQDSLTMDVVQTWKAIDEATVRDDKVIDALIHLSKADQNP